MANEDGKVTIPSGELNLSDIEIFYEVFKTTTPSDNNNSNTEEINSGTAKPTMIFLHGGPGIIDHNMYVPFWSQLADVADVHFLDIRGHGKSGGREIEYKETWCLRQWADDIVAYCKARNIEKPIIVGFSFGSWIAYDYLIRYPHHASKILFVNGEPWINVELRADKFKQRAIAKIMKAGETDISANEHGEMVKNIVLDLRAIAIGQKPSGEQNTAEMYVKYCIPLFSERPYTQEELSSCKTPNLSLWEHFDTNEYYSFDYRPQLSNLKLYFDSTKDQNIPEIFMIAGEYDPEHPFEGAKEAALFLDKHAKCIVIPNTGDPVYRDKPNESLELLRACISYSFLSNELNNTISKITNATESTIPIAKLNIHEERNRKNERLNDSNINQCQRPHTFSLKNN